MIPVLALKCNEVEVEPAQNNHVELPQASSHTKNMAIKASNNLFSFFSSPLFLASLTIFFLKKLEN